MRFFQPCKNGLRLSHAGISTRKVVGRDIALLRHLIQLRQRFPRLDFLPGASKGVPESRKIPGRTSRKGNGLAKFFHRLLRSSRLLIHTPQEKMRGRKVALELDCALSTLLRFFPDMP